jgi:hypothetical protein
MIPAASLIVQPRSVVVLAQIADASGLHESRVAEEH